MTRIERVTIRDIPLEKALYSPIPKEPPAVRISERSWVLLRIAGAAMILVALSLASNILDPSATSAVVAASRHIDSGLVAGIVGLALVVTIAVSSLASHEDE